jgi:hypothetical protein
VTWASVLMWIAPGHVGLQILNLFQHFWSNAILFGAETGAIGNFISSSYYTYVERLSYPSSKKHRTEDSIRVPRMFNHTHSNNMING